MDSNHRGVMNTTDLQSAAFSLSATSSNLAEVEGFEPSEPFDPSVF